MNHFCCFCGVRAFVVVATFSEVRDGFLLFVCLCFGWLVSWFAVGLVFNTPSLCAARAGHEKPLLLRPACLLHAGVEASVGIIVVHC